ncbi:MAG: hypothetical protein ACK4NS_04435 [Saprospiraceae bacterium]
MKKNTFFIVTALLLLLGACQKADHAAFGAYDCKMKFIKLNNLQPYTGAFNGCVYYYSLYQFKGQQYFLLDNPCADMVSIPVDCDGVPLTTSYDDPYLSVFYREADFVQIVGIVP